MTIDAEWFAELYKALESCQGENKGLIINRLDERDELKAKLEESNKHYCASATGKLGDACKVAALCRENEVKLAAAERCIDEIANKCDNNGLSFCEIMTIIRAYRAAKEAKCK